MAAPDFTNARWQKSTRSNGKQDCVEVAWNGPEVGTRDSKMGDHAPIAAYSRVAWASFLAVVKQGNADLH